MLTHLSRRRSRTRDAALVAASPGRWSRLALTATAALALTGAAATPALAADTAAPSQPGTLTQTPTDFGTTTLAWGASTDDVGVTEYDIFDGTSLLKSVAGTSTQTSITVAVSGGPHTYDFNVRAKDAAGNLSIPSNTVSVGKCPPGGAIAKTPTDIVVSAITDTTATLSWTPGTQDWCHTVPTGFTVSLTDNSISPITVPATQTSVTLTGLTLGTTYVARVIALPYTAIGGSTDPAPAPFTTTGGPADTQPPSQPGTPTYVGTDYAHATIRWAPSTDNVLVTAYDIYDGPGTLLATVPGTSTTANVVITIGTPFNHNVYVVARDAAGNSSAPSATVGLPGCNPIPPAPIAPTGVTVSAITPSTATVSWTPPARDFCHFNVQNFAIGVDSPQPLGSSPPASAVIVGATTTSFTLTGLLAGSVHVVQVFSTTTVPTRFTTASAAVPFTTPDFPNQFGVSGSATLKNVVKGSVPLAGFASASVDRATGAFSADLSLKPSTANLVALGFLPVTATVNFVSTAPTTGQLTGSSLTAVAKVRIKFPSIKTFGIQLAGGANCQATQVSNIPLTSTAFGAATGGTLAGTFSISNLSGCGALNGVVSPLTAGSGNTIALQLTPPVAIEA